MRRKDKALKNDEIKNLLRDGEYGVLSTAGSEHQPYGVPLNYVYMNDCLYFHCALVGHKLDNLAANDKVSFCVVGRTEVLPAEFTSGFESVIAFGRASVIYGEERYQALIGLLKKYSGDYMEEGRAYIEKLDQQTNVVKIEVTEVTGKAKQTSGM